jgi:hypothetical protein
MGGYDWPQHNWSIKTKLKIHVKQLKSITCPKICLHVPSKMPYTVVVLVQNPMAHSLSFALGFSILEEWESQTIHGPPFLNAWECGKFKNVGRATCGRPTLLTTTEGGWSSWQTTHEWHLGSSMSSTKHVGDLRMSSYVCWNTFGGAKLIHIHQNQWAHEPIETTSTYTSSLIQALICCHPTKIVGFKSFNGGTFSNKYAYVTFANVAQHKLIHRINLTWDQKVLNPFLLVKDLGTTIQKWPNQWAQSLPNLEPPTRWRCLVRNINNLVWLMLVLNGDTFVATSWHVAWKLVWLVDPSPHNGISKLKCPTVEVQLIIN